MKVILIVGGCGSGKTWVMKQLKTLTRAIMHLKVGMVHYYKSPDHKLGLAGIYDGTTFEGSDKLSMAVMRDVPDALELMGRSLKFAVFEGDRFTNKNFIALANPYIIKITDDGSKGRKLRGSSQTERQIRSIATRVSNVEANVEATDSKEALKIICKLVGL